MHGPEKVLNSPMLYLAVTGGKIMGALNTAC